MKQLFLLLTTIALLSGCGKKSEVSESAKVSIPVTITRPVEGPISQSVTLTATSSYLRKNIISSSMQGYIVNVDASIGGHVTKGQPLFEMQTKESHALSGNRIPDSLKKFTGTIIIAASSSGIITNVARQAGDYVQDGEQLCTVADAESFFFILSVPYDYIHSITPGESCQLLLPDSSAVPGRIVRKLSTIDAASQTQNFAVSIPANITIPENIIAQVKLATSQKSHATMLPKPAVLADETMQNFWVMKLQTDSMAVKIPVTKGIETSDMVEILSPVFQASDKFVLTGNYGMADTALVTIKEQH